MASTKYGFRSLRFKLALTSTLVEIIMLALLIANSSSIATQALEDQTRYRVEEILPLLNASLATPLVERDYATLDEIISQVVRKGGIEYLSIVDEDQRQVAKVGELPSGHSDHRASSRDASAYRHLDVPITLAGSTVGELHLSFDTSFLELTISTLRREGMMIAAGEVIITFVLLVLVGVLLTRNLESLANAARSMNSSGLTGRVEVKSRDEVGAMARAFNAMAARLESSYNLLKRSEQRYQTLAEVSPVGIFNTNAEGQCIYVNERYSEITGLPKERFFGTGWIETLHPDDRDEVVSEWEECARSGEPYVGEYRIVNAKGEVAWVYVQSVKADFFEGGYVGTVTDITQLKTIEQELALHRDSLEELVNERTQELETAQEKLLRQDRLATLGQLTATVSHELRNPLAVISNAVYFLKRKYPATDAPVDEKNRQYLEMIKREVDAADRIITDLLAASRAKKPVVQYLSLDELLGSIIGASKFPAHIHWHYLSDTTPFMMHADPAQLTQVLRNLLDNAVQAITETKAESGHICLYASEVAGEYQLRVMDTGYGVEDAVLDEVFEPLFTTKAKGNGLGLWISRELIGNHGGSLSYVAKAARNAGELEKTNADKLCAGKQGAEFLLVLPRNNESTA
jgi:PAS domain S-box-containing protein